MTTGILPEAGIARPAQRLASSVETHPMILWCLDYPIHLFSLAGGWNMTIVDADDGSEWILPGTHVDDAQTPGAWS